MSLGAFSGPLDLQEVDTPAGITEEREDRPLWRLTSAMVYGDGAGQTITVPAGFITDLASIPQFAWSFGFGPAGRWSRAAVVHDFLYATGGSGLWKGAKWISRPAPYSRPEADAIFDRAMAVLGVPTWRRAIMWAAVRVGGASGWGS